MGPPRLSHEERPALCAAPRRAGGIIWSPAELALRRRGKPPRGRSRSRAHVRREHGRAGNRDVLIPTAALLNWGKPFSP